MGYETLENLFDSFKRLSYSHLLLHNRCWYRLFTMVTLVTKRLLLEDLDQFCALDEHIMRKGMGHTMVSAT